MQSLPVVGISFDRTLPLSETNLDLGKLTFSLSEPAPVGGLSVNFNAVDSDGVPDDMVESRGAIMLRPSLLDPSVRLSPHSAPEYL